MAERTRRHEEIYGDKLLTSFDTTFFLWHFAPTPYYHIARNNITGEYSLHSYGTYIPHSTIRFGPISIPVWNPSKHNGYILNLGDIRKTSKEEREETTTGFKVRNLIYRGPTGEAEVEAVFRVNISDIVMERALERELRRRSGEWGNALPFLRRVLYRVGIGHPRREELMSDEERSGFLERLEYVPTPQDRADLDVALAEMYADKSIVRNPKLASRAINLVRRYREREEETEAIELLRERLDALIRQRAGLFTYEDAVAVLNYIVNLDMPLVNKGLYLKKEEVEDPATHERRTIADIKSIKDYQKLSRSKKAGYSFLPGLNSYYLEVIVLTVTPQLSADSRNSMNERFELEQRGTGLERYNRGKATYAEELVRRGVPPEEVAQILAYGELSQGGSGTIIGLIPK